jgi:hypothetical protein
MSGRRRPFLSKLSCVIVSFLERLFKGASKWREVQWPELEKTCRNSFAATRGLR